MLDPRLKLRHLQALVTVNRLGSVQASAQALLRTPSALSKSLAELEAIVGARLFDRHRSGLLPTAQGQALLREVHRSLAGLEDALDSASGRRPDAQQARLAIGVLPTAASTLLPATVARYQALQPDSLVQVLTGDNPGLLTQLRERRLDMVVGRLADPTMMLGLSFEPLYEEALLLVAARGHVLAGGNGGKALTMSQIAPWPVVLPFKDTLIRREVDHIFLGAGLTRLPQVVETLSEAFARALVAQGRALWCCTVGAAAADLAEGRFVALPLDLSATRGAVGLTLLADAPLSPAVLEMRELLRSQARQVQAARAAAAQSQWSS